MRRKKGNHRTIRLDLDVENIATELSSKRKLSEVLSELLRNEFGVSFEEDLLKSKINELERQKNEIDQSLRDLNISRKIKIDQQMKTHAIENLEKEFSLIKIKMDREIEEMRKMKNDYFNIDEKGLEGHEIMLALAKAKGAARVSIQNKYAIRAEQIQIDLAGLRSEH